MRYLLFGLQVIAVTYLSTSHSNDIAREANPCKQPPMKRGTNSSSSECISIDDSDVLSAIHWIAQPSDRNGAADTGKTCQQLNYIQGIAVCEDLINAAISARTCTVVSIITTYLCTELGSLDFEKYFSERGCTVAVFHFVFPVRQFRSHCSNRLKGHGTISIHRTDICDITPCFHKGNMGEVLSFLANARKANGVSFLKVQGISGVETDRLDGFQYTVLSELYLHLQPQLLRHTVEQLSFAASFNPQWLMDIPDRKMEHGWNIWATQQLLQLDFEVLSSQAVCGHGKTEGTGGSLRRCSSAGAEIFAELMQAARIPGNVSKYQHTFISKSLVQNASHMGTAAADTEVYSYSSSDTFDLPTFCTLPSDAQQQELMRRWIHRESNVRCHPSILTKECDRRRPYRALLPCAHQLRSQLAEDYAIAKRWCNFSDERSAIPQMHGVPEDAAASFQNILLTNEQGINSTAPPVRIAFFFIVYTDGDLVLRTLSHLYSPHHFYLIHVDPSGSSDDFKGLIRDAAQQYNSNFNNSCSESNNCITGNVFVVEAVAMRYGTATAAWALTTAMKWYVDRTNGWDYLLTLTGTDYPLVPLRSMERILSSRKPAMPFLMVWTPGASTHMFRLSKQHPIFESNSTLRRSFVALTDERGKVLGTLPMSIRAGNFGPPLFCSLTSAPASYVHLNNRRNRSAVAATSGEREYFDTQWLFPRDTKKGQALQEDNPLPHQFTYAQVDNNIRVWKKSDPGTTAAYDRQTVEYIVNSEEGRKYWHFFKKMLTAAEEHYYATLLFNWPRTRSFVQTVSAQITWNTWKYGIKLRAPGFRTHTNYLTIKEWDLVRALAARGVFFARKMRSDLSADLLDRIDEQLLFRREDDSCCKLYWPGWYEVDMVSSRQDWKRALRQNQTLLRMQQQQLRRQR